MILIVVKCDAYGEVDDEDDDHTDVESPEAYIQKKGQQDRQKLHKSQVCSRWGGWGWMGDWVDGG